MVVATGFFDGVHLGHRFLLEQLVKAAGERGDWSMVVTFWPHPRNVLQDDARNLRLLTTMEEKKRILTGIGVNYVEVIPFTRAFSRMTTEEYLREWIVERLGGRTILLGYDNRIGSDLRTPEETAGIAERLGLEVIRADRYTGPEGIVLSSTKIRNLLATGQVEKANAMLGYGYQLHGVVVAGNRLGRTMGFPTDNMQLYEPLKLIPVLIIKIPGNPVPVLIRLITKQIISGSPLCGNIKLLTHFQNRILCQFLVHALYYAHKI